jgi:uncharacterized protein YggE
MIRHAASAALILTLAACGGGKPDPRGMRPDETLLSLSASGEAATVPDLATMTMGVEASGKDAKAANQAATDKANAIVAALADFGVSKGDVQTSNVSLGRVDFGPRKGQYSASNTLTVRLHDVPRAGQAVAAATAAGANVLGGPSLQVDDPEKANRGAYIAAYKAARTRAEAYAEAAGMEIGRVIAIRDGGEGGGGYRPMATMDAAAPPPVIAQAAAVAPPPAIMPGTNRTRVTVQVDFALRPK